MFHPDQRKTCKRHLNTMLTAICLRGARAEVGYDHAIRCMHGRLPIGSANRNLKTTSSRASPFRSNLQSAETLDVQYIWHGEANIRIDGHCHHHGDSCWMAT